VVRFVDLGTKFRKNYCLSLHDRRLGHEGIVTREQELKWTTGGQNVLFRRVHEKRKTIISFVTSVLRYGKLGSH
jgi:hypothetical protein